MHPAEVEQRERRLAEQFLREIVADARAAAASPFAAPGAGVQCGLGGGPNLDFALSERSRELLHELCPAPAQVAGLTALVHAWVEEADQLDRRRNHFLKAFRQKHGNQRELYGPELLAAYESGLEEVNREVSLALGQRAAELCAELHR